MQGKMTSTGYQFLGKKPYSMLCLLKKTVCFLQVLILVILFFGLFSFTHSFIHPFMYLFQVGTYILLKEIVNSYTPTIYNKSNVTYAILQMKELLDNKRLCNEYLEAVS